MKKTEAKIIIILLLINSFIYAQNTSGEQITKFWEKQFFTTTQLLTHTTNQTIMVMEKKNIPYELKDNDVLYMYDASGSWWKTNGSNSDNIPYKSTTFINFGLDAPTLALFYVYLKEFKEKNPNVNVTITKNDANQFQFVATNK